MIVHFYKIRKRFNVNVREVMQKNFHRSLGEMWNIPEGGKNRARQHIIDYLGGRETSKLYPSIEGIIQLRGHLTHRAINFALLDETSILVMDPYLTDWLSFEGGKFIEYGDLSKYKYSDKLEILALARNDMTNFYEKWLENSIKLFKTIEKKLCIENKNLSEFRDIIHTSNEVNCPSYEIDPKLIHGSGTAETIDTKNHEQKSSPGSMVSRYLHDEDRK